MTHEELVEAGYEFEGGSSNHWEPPQIPAYYKRLDGVVDITVVNDETEIEFASGDNSVGSTLRNAKSISEIESFARLLYAATLGLPAVKLLLEALIAYRSAQRRMLDRWSEGDDDVKQELWQKLHACEAAADAAITAAKAEIGGMG